MSSDPQGRQFRFFKGDLEDYRRIILGRTALQKTNVRHTKKQTVKIEKKELRQIRAEISKIENKGRFERKIMKSSRIEFE